MTAAAATPWKPASEVVNAPRLERARRQARQVAIEFGHVLGVWDDDTDESSVATCLVCEDFAAVDASHMQPVEFNGRVLSRTCPGPLAQFRQLVYGRGL